MALLDERAATTLGRPWEDRRNTRPDISALARGSLALEPFSLAIPLALVLMREEELRGLITLSEVRARHLSATEARRAMEAASRGQ